MHWYDLTELLPPVFRNIKSMFSAAFTENIELLQVKSYLKAIADNFFIQTCDVKTLEYWESLLDIKVYGSETIEQRRQAVILHLANNQPITMLYVRKVMTDIFGEGNFELEYDDTTPYTLVLNVFNTTIDNLEKFILWFEQVCPAHMSWMAAHTEKADTDAPVIYAGAQSDYDAYAEAEMSAGTQTLYLGNNGISVVWVDL